LTFSRYCSFLHQYMIDLIWFLMFNATFSNISSISWRITSHLNWTQKDRHVMLEIWVLHSLLRNSRVKKFQWCPTHIVLCFYFFFLCLVYPMLSVSLDCPFLISPSVFFFNGEFFPYKDMKKQIYTSKKKCMFESVR
jgi:hypothetical protein